MKITVTTNDEQVFSLEVSPDMELLNFKALVNLECPQLNTDSMQILLHGKPLIGDDKPLSYFKVQDGKLH